MNILVNYFSWQRSKMLVGNMSKIPSIHSVSYFLERRFGNVRSCPRLNYVQSRETYQAAISRVSRKAYLRLGYGSYPGQVIQIVHVRCTATVYSTHCRVRFPTAQCRLTSLFNTCLLYTSPSPRD